MSSASPCFGFSTALSDASVASWNSCSPSQAVRVAPDSVCCPLKPRVIFRQLMEWLSEGSMHGNNSRNRRSYTPLPPSGVSQTQPISHLWRLNDRRRRSWLLKRLHIFGSIFGPATADLARARLTCYRCRVSFSENPIRLCMHNATNGIPAVLNRLFIRR